MLRNKLKVLLAVQDGLVEIKTAKREDKKLQMLSDFLNESN
jgi:methionyl-tRNA formyltransferase